MEQLWAISGWPSGITSEIGIFSLKVASLLYSTLLTFQTFGVSNVQSSFALYYSIILPTDLCL